MVKVALQKREWHSSEPLYDARHIRNAAAEQCHLCIVLDCQLQGKIGTHDEEDLLCKKLWVVVYPMHDDQRVVDICFTNQGGRRYSAGLRMAFVAKTDLDQYRGSGYPKRQIDLAIQCAVQRLLTFFVGGCGIVTSAILLVKHGGEGRGDFQPAYCILAMLQ